MEAIFIIGGFFLLFAPVMAIISLVRVSSIQVRLRSLENEVKKLRLAAKEAAAAPPPPETAAAPTPKVPAEPAPEPAAETATPPQQQSSAPYAAKPQPAKRRPPPVPPKRPAGRSGPNKNWFPETLKAANWLIIAGGTALSFGLVFLVKYSIDEGWLGPVARVTIGCFFGAGLLVAGDLARRKAFGRVAAIAKSDAFPATLTAAGIIALFASVYGAYELYGLLPPLVTFAALAVISVIAVLLSFFHGPLIAALGLIGAYCVPLLVSTNQPAAETLFGYLLFVTIGSTLTARLRHWWWLSTGVLIASVFWTFMWETTAASPGDNMVLLTYWLVTGLLFVGLIANNPLEKEPSEGAKPLANADQKIGLAGSVLSALLVFLIFAANPHTTYSIMVLSVLVLGYLGFAWQKDILLPHLFVAAGTGLLALVTWEFHVPALGDIGSEMDQVVNSARMPKGSQSLGIAAAALAGLFVVAGFMRVWYGRAWSGLWSAVGVTMALLCLVSVYLRVNGLENSVSWAFLGMGAALGFLYAARFVKARAGDEIADPALAAYAVGVLASLGLGFTMALERAWLTVGLALLLPAMGWVYTRLPIPVLRKVALVTAGAVLVRLLFNQYVFDYDIVKPLIFNWMLYGYGIPAVAFLAASRLFRRDKRDGTVNLLETGALVFAVFCLSIQVRIFIHGGDLTVNSYLLSEAAINTIIWITIAYGLFRRAGEGAEGASSEGASPVAIIGARVLAYLSLAHIGLVHVLVLNPWWSGEHIGSWPVFNTLFLAYALPALLLSSFFLPWHRERLVGVFAPSGKNSGGAALSVFAFILGLIYITLEVTRAFHGTDLTAGAGTDGEFYAYSLVWMLYAGVLMGVGVWRSIPVLRMAALAVIALASFKIFAFDMRNLVGLLRVFSFFGLAFSFFAIAYLYQRFVVTTQIEPVEEPKTSES